VPKTSTSPSAPVSFTVLWRALRTAWPPVERHLGPEELERYGAEGAAMSLDEAVGYALDVPLAELGSHEHGRA
jgi:hypothetical protein